MLEENVKTFFDKIYSENQNPYGETPSPLVEEIPKLFQKGKVLDLGCGSGRNSLFLAQQGFEVKALDISKIGLQILQAEAQKKKLKIKIKLADLNKFKIKNQYTALICAFTIHNLSHKNGLGLVNKMQKHTKIGGLNLITAFTRNSYFYENRKNQINFYPPSKFELTQLYAGWKILENIEEKIKIRPTREDGSSIFSTFAGILAQKKS